MSLLLDTVKVGLYFGPLYLVLLWKMKYAIARKLSDYVLVSMFLFMSFLPFGFSLNLFPEVVMVGILGRNIYIWSALFIYVALAIWMRGYPRSYGIVMAVMATFAATEVWEIPHHFLAVKFNPTVEQVLVTMMLTSPYLALLPFYFKELWKNGRKWAVALIVLSIVVDVVTWFVRFPSKFPDEVWNFESRVIWAIMFGGSATLLPLIPKTEHILINQAM